MLPTTLTIVYVDYDEHQVNASIRSPHVTCCTIWQRRKAPIEMLIFVETVNVGLRNVSVCVSETELMKNVGSAAFLSFS